jgi:hypothetical protein
VETGNTGGSYLTEIQAGETVLHLREVARLMEEDDDQVCIETVELPSQDDPVYLIKVSERKGDNWETYSLYAVDAQTGQVLK